jgi:hypothetical protein
MPTELGLVSVECKGVETRSGGYATGVGTGQELPRSGAMTLVVGGIGGSASLDKLDHVKHSTRPASIWK